MDIADSEHYLSCYQLILTSQLSRGVAIAVTMCLGGRDVSVLMERAALSSHYSVLTLFVSRGGTTTTVMFSGGRRACNMLSLPFKRIWPLIGLHVWGKQPTRSQLILLHRYCSLSL